MANVNGKLAFVGPSSKRRRIQPCEERFGTGNRAIVLRRSHVHGGITLAKVFGKQPQLVHIPFSQHGAKRQVLVEAFAGELSRIALQLKDEL